MEPCSGAGSRLKLRVHTRIYNGRLRTSYPLFAGLAALITLQCAAAESPDVVLNSFTLASTQSDLQMRGASMNVEIVASLPKLEKTASLQGVRRVSRAGAISYEGLQLTGDASLRQQIIARYLSAEENRGHERDLQTLALTTANYRFQWKGMEPVDARQAYLFRVKPRKKREGAFDGLIWIDAATYLPLRESGRVVQHSIFLRRLTMVRKFRIVDQRLAIPETTDLDIDTRLVGRAQMNVKVGTVSWEAPDSANVSSVPAVQ